MVVKVAVIGTGAAGLCALKHLTEKPQLFEVIAFEQQVNVGGTWHYTDKVGTDANGLPIQSSMYKNLKTNLPKEVMAFPGFTFPANLPSFIKHEDVLRYLQDYCSHYSLDKYIKFETKVDHVDVLEIGDCTKWKVLYSPVADTNCQQSCVVDAVMVCNGHYTVPLIPKIEGIDRFQGLVTHSHEYRIPDPFKDKIVVCLGGAASGQDISLDIATVAKKVILSHNKSLLETPLPVNVSQQPGIEKVFDDTVLYKNGIEEKVDAIMLCTGYRYHFPFLDEKCMVNIEHERVVPLYKHIINCNYPSMSFIGICKHICPFPQFENQVRYVITILDCSRKLPDRTTMLQEVEDEYQQRLQEGLPSHYAHTMGTRQWKYNDSLAESGQFEPLPKVVQLLYDHVHGMRLQSLQSYKDKQYRITGEASFQELLEM